MMFDLGSTRHALDCAAVGTVLAQRSLEDDIHDVMYTPRKGDKVEGKLQVVLQAIIDTGVVVKVKLKQRKLKKKTSHIYNIALYASRVRPAQEAVRLMGQLGRPVVAQ
ncbi:hypothetical protein F2Q69_00030714 [Brassica cretica]|uniref:Uncharacterized protein n=1 Tax=Brassica cretica TaxID=69181 RepID=A0A8S9RUF5_BRACR|nr:hypothetical protein F2Q69_00030714 [Brassica cretica]